MSFVDEAVPIVVKFLPKLMAFRSEAPLKSLAETYDWSMLPWRKRKWPLLYALVEVFAKSICASFLVEETREQG